MAPKRVRPALPADSGLDELGDRQEVFLLAEGAHGLELRGDGVALFLLLFGRYPGVDDTGLH